MSTVIRPAAPQHPALADSEHYIDEQISRTRRALKLVDFTAGVITLAIGLIAFLLVAAVLDHWVVPGGLNGAARTALFGALIVAAAWYFWHQFVPLLKPINPVYAAHTIERGSPSLKNSLLNLVFFRTHRQEMSARVYHALQQQTAERLSTAGADATVDRSALLRLGYALAAIIALGALYAVLSPKELGVSAGRVLAPWADLAAPSRVKILDVRPGATSIALGELLAVSAEVHGLQTDEPVRLMYSTADEQTVDESIPMSLAAAGGRYEAQLPRGTGGQGAVGVQQNLSYWIEAGDARSKPFPVTVFLRPTLVVQRVRYDYPAYTGLPSQEVESTGDLRGIEGTRVSLSALANQPIKHAYVDFDADGRNDVKMNVDGNTAVASFELALREDRRTPKHDSYVLRLTTTADRTNVDPPKYSIDVTPDYPPEVRVTAPEEPDLEVRVDEIVPISVEAHDPDFALAGVRLVGQAGDREIEMGELLSERREGRFGGKRLFTPGDVQLKPGDVLEYWAEARDVRRPEPHVTASERRRLRIVGGPDEGAAGEGQQPKGGEANDGEQGDGGNADGEQQGGQAGGSEAGGEQSDGEGEAAEGAGATGGGKSSEQSPDGKGEDSGGAGESSDSAEGENQGAGSGGKPGQEQGAGEQAEASADQQPGGESGEPSEAGEQQGDSPSEAGESEPGKVSAAGDSDAEAFDRIAQHMEQEGQSEGEPTEGEQPKQGEQQNGDPSEGAQGASKGASAEAGEQSLSGNPSAGEKQQGDSAQASQDPRETAGEGQQQGGEGEPQPNERPGADVPRESKPGDGNPGEANDSERAQDSTMNRNQGDAGSGADGEQPEGSASDGSAKQARDKQDADNRERMDDQTPAGGSNSKKESNSSGGQSGDKSGGGQSGSGQQADAKGKGAAGQNSAADEGAGAAEEPGQGETGPNGGADKPADGKTGESSGDEAGDGSETGDAKNGAEGASPPKPGEPGAGEPGGKQPGDKQPGAADQGEDASGQGGSSQGKNGSEKQGASPPGEADAQDPAQQPGQSGGNSPAGAQDGPQAADPPTKPQPQSPPQQGAEGAAGDNPQGGGQGAADGSSGTPSQLTPEEANLEFARKQTDLVLERLDQQLAKKQVDKNLLKSLGWSEEELRQFVDRWKGLKQEAAQADGEEAQQELDAALKALGMRPGGPRRYSAASKDDRIRDLNEDVRKQAPQEYLDRVRNYNKGISTAPK